jgi:sec-independent protein translocase protein TatA
VLAEIFGVDGIIVIVVVALVLLFGGSQLPKLARGLGSASHEFKKGMAEGDGTPPPSAVPPPVASAVPPPVESPAPGSDPS